jgi:hypothetical protein
LLSDAQNFAISISLNFRDEIDSTTFDNLMEENRNVVYKLSCLESSIKNEVFLVLDYFLSFLRKNEKRKAFNMFFLMLDPRFKMLRLVSSLIGHEQGKVIVEIFYKQSLFSMFLKCYYHLHPLVESKRGVVDQRVEEDKNLNINV